MSNFIINDEILLNEQEQNTNKSLEPITLKHESVTLEQEILDQETLESVTLEPVTLEPVILEQETLEPVTLEQETLEQEILDQETLEPVTLEQEPTQDIQKITNKYNIQYGVDTDIGGNKENQDDYLILQINDLYIFGIFDGHGNKNGKHVALCAKYSMKEYFENNEFVSPQEFFNNLFDYTNNQIKDFLKIENIIETQKGYLISSLTFQYVDGGTTCSILVIKGNKCYYAHVGDSSGLICTKNENQEIIKYNYEELGENHSPTSIDEYKRINTYVEPLKFEYDNIKGVNTRNELFTIIDNEPVITDKGLFFKNVRHEYASVVTIPETSLFMNHSLAMTRSLGDFIFKYHGVCQTPSIIEFDLETKFETVKDNILSIVLASDGVWDNWKFSKVSEFVMYDNCIQSLTELNSTQLIVEAFMERNKQYGKNNFGNNTDNATTIIIYITL